jgi:hypothetical protein
LLQVPSLRSAIFGWSHAWVAAERSRCEVGCLGRVGERDGVVVDHRLAGGTARRRRVVRDRRVPRSTDLLSAALRDRRGAAPGAGGTYAPVRGWCPAEWRGRSNWRNPQATGRIALAGSLVGARRAGTSVDRATTRGGTYRTAPKRRRRTVIGYTTTGDTTCLKLYAAREVFHLVRAIQSQPSRIGAVTRRSPGWEAPPSRGFVVWERAGPPRATWRPYTAAAR